MARYTDPPEKPNCLGEDPVLFDDQLFFGMALAICQDCPVRWWCLNTVDPKRNYYDGVVGGHAWHDGKPIPKYSDIYGDPVLTTYMGGVVRASQKRPVDNLKVLDFMVGRVAWTRLTVDERVEAARRMKRQGTTPELAEKFTHLPKTTITAIWKKEE